MLLFASSTHQENSLNISDFDWKRITRLFNLTVGIAVLILTIVNVTSLLHRTSLPKGILFSIDNDAGRAIQTAQLSRWYNSNHFAPYGNLYFRIAHSFAKLAPTEIVGELNETEKEEVIHHFALKLTSLFSLLLFCFFISNIITRNWVYSIGLTAILLRCFLHDEILVKYIFRAHPDHMLMLASAVASYFTFRYLNSRTERDFKLSAVLWGIAFAVKRSLVLFIPSLIYTFLSEGLNKKSVLNGLKFSGWMLGSYLIIGFPQNFGFGKHISFMLSESNNSVPADMRSVLGFSLLIWNQIKYVLIPILIAHLIWGHRYLREVRQILIFVSIAMIILFSRKMMSISEHHTFPHSGVLIVLFVIMIQFLPVLSIRLREFFFGLTLIIFCYFISGNTPALSKVYKDQNRCINESFEYLSIVKKEQKETKVFARDPYVPFDSSLPKITKRFWGLTSENILSSKAQLIGSNSWFSSRYLSPAPEFLRAEEKASWGQKTTLYQSMVGKSEMNISGKSFRKIYEDSCGLTLWKLI